MQRSCCFEREEVVARQMISFVTVGMLDLQTCAP